MRQVNLLPEENQKSETMRLIRNSLCKNFLPVIAGMIPIHFFLAFSLSDLERTVQIPQRYHETPRVLQIRQEIKNMKSKASGLFASNKDLVVNFLANLPSSQLLKKIGNVTSERVWLTNLALDMSKGMCEMNGRSFNIRLVSEFILELKRLPYFTSVELVTMEGNQKEKEGEINFKIVCKLK